MTLHHIRLELAREADAPHGDPRDGYDLVMTLDQQSRLDAATEAQVLDRLSQRLQRTGQGLILVSHRPAPLALCDQALTVSGISQNGHIQANVGPLRAAA